ncbi:hypothetical protein [Diaphorobacter caeni]|uniref:hypothetical protein n=1 Tax=Diaphorobacter caeni TaxID=2784387 RepID=UPI00188E491D|nr:hypothetical protein [Diaphorobacter caeni]MBF5006570.1 hypothetical protein [Diaphorobacter caeni]
MEHFSVNAALLIRMLCTAIVVIGVSWSVGAFGPIIGGALAGLPMVMGPAFFFLVRQAPVDFVSLTATYTLISLAATQAFVLAYLFASRRHRPLASLAIAFGAWVITAALCRMLPPYLWLGVALFVVVTWGAIRVSRPFVDRTAGTGGKAGWPLLLLRGALAGVMVASITTASGWLGASSAGILLAFPIGYTVIATTIHERYGSASVIATLHAALLGGCSLAVFCFCVAVFVQHMEPMVGLLLATVASMLTTTALVLRTRLRRG